MCALAISLDSCTLVAEELEALPIGACHHCMFGNNVKQNLFFDFHNFLFFSVVLIRFAVLRGSHSLRGIK